MRTLLTAEELRDGVARLAGQISADYGDRPLTLICVLTGSMVFTADLIRVLRMPLRVALVGASSYRGRTTNPGALTVHADLLPDIQGRDTLLADDIFDSGQTLFALDAQLRSAGAASVRSAVLLRKILPPDSDRRRVGYRPDYVGFEIPDEFVVGYGLDYNDLYRNLPHLAALEEHER